MDVPDSGGSVSEEDWQQEAVNLRREMKDPKFQKFYQQIQSAVIMTRQEVLAYQDEICRGIFHRVSAGYTRDGSDVFESGYKYITGVESVVDQESEEYLTGHYFTPDFLEKEFLNFGMPLSFSEGDEITVKTRDEAGYAAEVKVEIPSAAEKKYVSFFTCLPPVLPLKIRGKRFVFSAAGRVMAWV